MYTLVGYRRSVGDWEHGHYDNYYLSVTCDFYQGADSMGVNVKSFKVPARYFNPDEFAIGDTIDVYFDENKRVCCVVRV